MCDKNTPVYNPRVLMKICCKMEDVSGDYRSQPQRFSVLLRVSGVSVTCWFGPEADPAGVTKALPGAGLDGADVLGARVQGGQGDAVCGRRNLDLRVQIVGDHHRCA